MGVAASATSKGAQALLVVLKDAEVDLESTVMAVGWQVRDWLPTAVHSGQHEALATHADADGAQVNLPSSAH